MDTFDRTDRTIIATSERRGFPLLRWSLAVVFVWFGALKFGAGQSAAEDLAAQTIERLTGGRVGPGPGLRILAFVECAVGLGMLSRRLLRPTLALMAFHLVGASSPLVILPRRCFRRPWAPTLEGQYIIKNAVLAAAGFVLASSVPRRERCGGALTNRQPGL